MAQEYGRYFGLKAGVFRGGCLTGPHHSGVELHGFLTTSSRSPCTAASTRSSATRGSRSATRFTAHDVMRALEAFAENPRRARSTTSAAAARTALSVLECIDAIEQLTGKKLSYEYVDENRKGDHICYISDLRKLQAHYPSWSITRSLSDILKEMVAR